MILSPQQEKAVAAVASWLKVPFNQSPYFYFGGYAGTGKTTLAKHFAEQQDGKVLFAAYTGKAASVLQKKGCNASTIHSLIYKVQQPDRKLIQECQQKLKDISDKSSEAYTKTLTTLRDLNKPKFTLNDESELQEADLLILDEVSMVNKEVAEDLLSFGIKILVLGDPGQLPPVEGTGYFTGQAPNFLLNEIHRQALNNPIIMMAQMVRQGNRLKLGKYGESSVIPRDQINLEDIIQTEAQIIVGLNRTRAKLNSVVRDWNDRSGATCPEVGEKIICLRNNREVGILNGTQWIVESSKDNGLYNELDLISFDNPEAKVSISSHPFGQDLKSLFWYQRKQYEEFDFGYAITCHKSQGSQWRNVFIQNESYVFREHQSRWLYTALTRAEEVVTVAQ